MAQIERSNETERLLDVRHLRTQFSTDEGIAKAAEDVSFYVEQGETLGIVGESGSGKSVSALSVMRLVTGKITGGEILFQGQDLLKLTEEQMEDIRGNEIAMIFQDPMTSLDPVKTVGDQIQEMIELHENLSRGEARARAADMLEVVGIKRERANDYPHQFSGGMKQRVVIAMALSCNPKLLIADEPTTALDVTIQAQVLELMKKLKGEYRMSMIMITHDLGVVAEICDKVAVLYAGNIVEYGAMEDVFDTPLHPYTRALFDATPALDGEKHELSVIPGFSPNPMDLPGGCPFHPRCKEAREACRTVAPGPFEAAPGHFVCCLAHGRGDQISPEEVEV